MPRLVVNFWFLAVSFLFLIHPVTTFAQPSTPTPSVIPTGQPTCDLCGWCNQLYTPKPPDWDTCRACLYDASGKEAIGSYYTVFGCLSTSPEKFVKSMLTVIFSISGGIAFLSVIFGSTMVLTSSGNPEKLQSGKDIITSSIVGILLIIFSVFILRVIGYDVFRIPGFG